MARVLPLPTSRLRRFWSACLAVAAALVLGSAWFLSQGLELGSEAEALQAARDLLPALEARARSFRDELARGQAGLPVLSTFRLDEAGRLIEPHPLPVGRPLRDVTPDTPAGAPSPAAVWLGEARARLATGDAEAARKALDSGEAVLGAEEAATRARFQLLRARTFQALKRPEEAAALLQSLRGRHPLDSRLDGTSLHLVAGLRLAEALEAAGNREEALRVRRLLLDDLLAGRLPLSPGRLRYEAQELAAQVAGGEEDSRVFGERVETAAASFAAAGEIRTALAERSPEETAVPSGEHLILLEDSGRSGRVYDRAAVQAGLASALRELLPPAGAFSLAGAGETPPGPVMGVPALPAGLEGGFRLLLSRPEVFSEPARRRRIWLWTVSGLLAAALLGVGLLGSHALRRREELERLRSAFVAGVSHDLRTPAASLGLLASNLAEGRVADPARQQEYFQALQRDALRLQQLVAGVLDFSRLERGVFRVAPRPVAPAPLLARVAAGHRERMEEAGMELAVEIAEDLPVTPLDEETFERALSNLLENARRYAAAGGRVLLEARREGGELLVAVEDRGPGIAPRFAPRVFEPFERGPEAAQGGGFAGGAGLGLSLVRETVQAHGGRVRLMAGAEGLGARFELRFPLQEGGGKA